MTSPPSPTPSGPHPGPSPDQPSREHRVRAAAHAAARAIPCAVLTISDTRTLATDGGGGRIASLLEAGGHVVAARAIVPDDAPAIAAALDGWIADASVRVVLTTGGTGFSRRDTTVEVVRARLTREMEGFGELFRSISYTEIGAAAMLSRAVAGLAVRADAAGGDTWLFALPGSVNAVETAMARLILPELGHLVWERRTVETPPA